MALKKEEVSHCRKLGMQRAAVRFLLAHEISCRGSNGKILAETLGCSEPTVSKTLCGKRHSP